MLPDAVYAPSCYAEGTGLSSTAKTQTSTISIVQSDKYGNVITSDLSRFTWYINQGQKTDATFEGNGIYTFSYVLSSLGFYQLSVILTEVCVTPDTCTPDGRGILKSPFRVECISNVGPVSPLESTMVGSSYMFRSADSVDPIVVQTRDSSGLPLLGEDVQIQGVKINVRVSSSSIPVIDNNDGTFSFVPRLSTAGIFVVWANNSITFAPTRVDDVQSKDSFGNNLTTGGLFFNVLIGGPPFLFANVEDLNNPSSSAVSPQYNGQYVVTYRTTVSADYYKVSIRRSGIHILGSPYSLRVTGGITWVFSSFWILTRDEFNNNVVDGTDVFVVLFSPDLARDSNDTAITPWVNASKGMSLQRLDYTVSRSL
ncbi:hypothetical protein GUITHDRAFT_109173 [Guillardia theta CCMP2712]|uniref:Uncharacterized protein n=1 Tax=Guillardia theta (strain CCMP2712) TaxID=905079 RepID=L1J995_GUITC|nr:hypothetical protein GUITHDRAFT_109173 [Guillardia theta CCMP2712]EKX45128.1 hypothetical protein GUITHDRAFT_109173 [Guillardia theta CCMP2712]|eukprot:XP_005832108.1 hypothetical protein GUITHDRAFT_109173 [Guillardia theta CCMP2712]